ncbi:ankyrin repeat-containing domain protein, partial [Talaromyces proteolyticus]
GQTKHVEYLLNAKVSTEFKDDDDRTPLLCAVEENNIDIVELLLRSKADWNARNKSKRTVLHIASSNGSNGIVLKFLSIPELDLDAQDEQFETPLHLAVRSGHQMAVKFLLEFGANVNAKDKKGFTPLHLAAAKRGPTLVKMIL